MRSGFLVFFLLVAAFMQGMNNIHAHEQQQARMTIDQQVQSQR